MIGLHPTVAKDSGDAAPSPAGPYSRAGQGATLTFVMDEGVPEMVQVLKARGVACNEIVVRRLQSTSTVATKDLAAHAVGRAACGQCGVQDAGHRTMVNFQDSEGNWLHLFQFNKRGGQGGEQHGQEQQPSK